MSSTFFGASFDATDAARTARFWAAVLDREVAEGADEHDAVVKAGDPSGGPRLAFH
ncbi:VOC family protein [Nonomuraea sp. NPDC050536]|uniref:VOC family protein n=1 Tax=Nonomuraea sp. NPDC050536 TaxID=3364366 RepID=UPI0037CAD4C0